MPAPHPLGPLARLAELDQFIVALLVPLRDGRTDKVPCDFRTARTHVDAHDPHHWTSYANAATIAATWGAGFVVGFVITAADPWVCIDIDSALQPDGHWHELSHELCGALPGAVIERSQSGRGLHAWARLADVPAHASKNTALHIEAYSERRFIVLGTQQAGTLAEDCPAMRDVLARYFAPREAADHDVPDGGPRADWVGPRDDDELLRRAMQSRSTSSTFGGGKASFAELYAADAAALARAYPPDANSSEPYDRSSADAALAQHLAFWTGRDVARIERIMRTSALRRDKWDDREDYLVERTIGNACRMQREVLQDKRVQTAERVISALGEMTADEVAANWKALTIPLPADQREVVIERRHHMAGLSPQAMRKALKDADAAAAHDQRQQAIAERAQGRRLIENRPEDCTTQAREIEDSIIAAVDPGEYVSFGGVLCQVTTKPLPFTHLIDSPDEAPPDVPQIEPLDKVAVLQLVERVAVFFDIQATGKQKIVGVPDRILEVLIGKKVHAAAQVNGLVTHPIVLPSGEVLAANGLHSGSGIFVSGCSVAGAVPYSQPDAVAALQRLRSTFLDGFEFASQLDEDVALAGLFTGVQRRLLDGAPGLAVLASTQSSGKTTLARRIHVLLTGRDMPVSTFPLGDESEVSKRLLSTLLRGPAMICFDNIQDGQTFASGSLAAAMTSSSLEQRVLGISRDASAPTSVLFALTGNNLSLGNDEVTRWMVTRLAPKSSRPEERQFVHPDVVAHALSVRGRVLRDVVGIIAGYAAGRFSASLPGTRFPTWDRMVRQPLHWAGALDVAMVFRSNTEDSETVRAFRSLLWALWHLYPDRDFKASEVAVAASNPLLPQRDTLVYSLEMLNAKSADSAKSVASVLKAIVGKVADVDGREIRLSKRTDAHDKVDRYRVSTLAGFAGF